MRIALLSALAENPDFKGERLAFRRFVGRSVLAHQVGLALALKCEKILCLATGLSQEIISCQHLAEKGGAKFVTIDSNRRLPSLVTADSDVLVVADGLLADTETVVGGLDSHARVLTVPAEIGVVSGFERIDQDRAWAGAMRVRGSLIERLADLPDDANPSSALLRIALQAGVKTLALDPKVMREGRWSLHESPSARETREKSWLASRLTPAPYRAPGLAVTERIGMRLARDLLGGRLQRLPWVSAAGFGIIAAAFGTFGHPLIGLGCLLAMALTINLSHVFERLSEPQVPSSLPLSLSKVLSLVCDVLIASLVALSTPEEFGWARVFIPFAMIAVVLLGEQTAPARWQATFRDRIALIAILLPACVLGYPQEASAALIALGLGALYFFSTDVDEEDDPVNDRSVKS